MVEAGQLLSGSKYARFIDILLASSPIILPSWPPPMIPNVISLGESRDLSRKRFIDRIKNYCKFKVSKLL
jgi:hypothetical protein